MIASMPTSMKTKSGVRNTCTCELHDLLRSVKRHRYIDIFNKRYCIQKIAVFALSKPYANSIVELK